MPLTLLLLHQCIEQNRIEIFRNGGIIAFCHLHDLCHRHNTVYDVQGIKGLLGSPDTVSLLPRSGRAHLGIGIFHVGIFQFYRIRCL